MKKLVTVLLGIVMCISVTGCVSFGADKAYPVKFDETEVLVGKTKAGALLDAGFTLKALNVGELPADTPLEKNMYYTGINVIKDDVTYAMIELAMGGKDGALPDAVVANIMVREELDHALDRISFDGVLLTEVSADVFKEHVSGSKVDEEGTIAYYYGSNYMVSVSYNAGKVTELYMRKQYSVQYGN